jgi:predicted O-methyltransferase YrrM
MVSLTSVGRAVRDPVAGWAYLAGGFRNVLDLYEARFLAPFLTATVRTVRRTSRELAGDRVDELVAARKGVQGVGELGHGRLLYALVRLARPQVVVETGVASGVSSAYLLKALERNGSGTLHSVDMPNYEEILEKQGAIPQATAILPRGKEVGYAVPDDLRSRWDLRLGLSREILPPLLQSAGPIDLYLHDSEHTYANMSWEYEQAWPVLRPGGILASDDVGLNRAFADFASAHGGSAAVYDGRIGLLRRG